MFRVRVGVGRRLGLKIKSSFHVNLDCCGRANNIMCVDLLPDSEWYDAVPSYAADYLNEIMKVKQNMQS